MGFVIDTIVKGVLMFMSLTGATMIGAFMGGYDGTKDPFAITVICVTAIMTVLFATLVVCA